MTNKDFKEGMKERSLLGGTVDYQYSANYQPKHRTIDDLECGDYVVDKDVEKKLKCLAKCGEGYGMSCINEPENFGTWYTLEELKDLGCTLYQPEEVKEKTARERILELMRDSDQEWACDEIIKLKEKETDIDKCIKVVEEYFEGMVLGIMPQATKERIVQALKNLKK